MKLSDYIFSIKISKDKRQKVYTIMGIKFKIKRKFKSVESVNLYKENKQISQEHKNKFYNECYFPIKENTPELHLNLLWQNARYKENEILENIAKNLMIVGCYNIT